MPECDAALMAGEAAPMEELSLCADALQHVHPLTTEVTLLAVCHQHSSFRLRLRSHIGDRTQCRGHRRSWRLRKRSDSRFRINKATPAIVDCAENKWRSCSCGLLNKTHIVLISHPGLRVFGLFLSYQLFLQRKQVKTSQDLTLLIMWNSHKHDEII